MEEKKENRGGDRRSGTGVKTARMFGYKYTPKEHEEMTRALESIKADKSVTTSETLQMILRKEEKLKVYINGINEEKIVNALNEMYSIKINEIRWFDILGDNRLTIDQKVKIVMLGLENSNFNTIKEDIEGALELIQGFKSFQNITLEICGVRYEEGKLGFVYKKK